MPYEEFLEWNEFFKLENEKLKEEERKHKKGSGMSPSGGKARTFGKRR